MTVPARRRKLFSLVRSSVRAWTERTITTKFADEPTGAFEKNDGKVSRVNLLFLLQSIRFNSIVRRVKRGMKSGTVR